MPKLSIVIPVYNGEKYLYSCLGNLQKQTFTDWEAIFVNDGSTDSTRDILEELAAKDKRIEIVHKKNGGTASARNAGQDKATGTYITFLDSDDELEPVMYEKLVGTMDIHNVDMAVCGYYFKVENKDSKNYLEKNTYPSKVLRTKDEIKEELIDLWDSDMLSNVWNKIYKMKLIKEKGLRYRDGHVYTEDRVYNRQFIENCSSMAVLEDCLYYYVRERAGSTTEKFRDNYFDIRHKEFEEFQIHFKNMGVWNEKAKEYVCREFLERIAGCIENIFHADDMPSEEIKTRIKEIINHPDAKTAAKYAKCRSAKMRIFVWPIKRCWTGGTYLMGKLIYEIRHANPALFHKLKNNR